MKNYGKNLIIAVMSVGLVLFSGGCGTGGEEESTAGSGNFFNEGITISENAVQGTAGQDAGAQDTAAQSDAGQTIADQKEDAYSGLYVDTQGTSDIYSELELSCQEEGMYKVTIGLYRLTTLEGIALAEGEILFFEDEIAQVRGEIRIQDTKAVFTVTESEFAYLEAGNVFEFPEKR